MKSYPLPIERNLTNVSQHGKQDRVFHIRDPTASPQAYAPAQTPTAAEKTKSTAFYDKELRLERSSPEEKRHEAFRISVTYILLNVVTIVVAHASIAPVWKPHDFYPVATSKSGAMAWKVFCGFWGIVTGFYNLVLGWYGLRLLKMKWKSEAAEGHMNTYRVPPHQGGNVRIDPRTNYNQMGRQGQTGNMGNSRPTNTIFAQNNPYTAARRTHSGTFWAERRTKNRWPSSLFDEEPQFVIDSEPIMEEDEEPEDFAPDVGSKDEDGVAKNDASGPEERDKVDAIPRDADSYPFPKTEEAQSSTTWSNSATSAGEFARKRKAKKKLKGIKLGTRPKVDVEVPEEGFICSSPNCAKVKQGVVGSSSSSSHSCGRCSASANSWNDRDRLLKKAIKQMAASSSEEDSSSRSGQERSESTGDENLQIRVVTESDGQKDRDGVPQGQNEHEHFEYETQIPDSRMIKETTYHDQQAAFARMNQAIWSEVGEHMERQLRIQEPTHEKENQAKQSSNGASKGSWWTFGRGNEKRTEEFEMGDMKKKGVPVAKKRSGLRSRVYILVAIFASCGIATTLPPFLLLAGDMLVHDFQYQHACDGARWDIGLDASGLHPEQNNVYNRAIFKDRRAKGYEREFMMNLEGMRTYGDGLDVSLADERRGYVFYISQRDLENQPGNGESIKFPYPVVVAYDLLKHSYYAHDTVWRNLNDESFFDGGSFMNGTLGIFPSEGIWLEKKEKDGFCGQPRRTLKNAYDQRIIWTTVDNRKDCTLFRVCASDRATRRQVVIATGMILLRLAMSANCCSKEVSRLTANVDLLANSD